MEFNTKIVDILPALKCEDSLRGGLQSIKDCGVCQHPVIPTPAGVRDYGFTLFSDIQTANDIGIHDLVALGAVEQPSCYSLTFSSTK